MRKIDKIALVDAALAGKPVERVPFSIWHHFPDSARAGRACAVAHVTHFRRYDLDFLKVMNDNPYDMPSSMRFVTLPKEWGKLEPLKGGEAGFAAELEALREIKKAIGAETRFIATVFSPFSVAMDLARQRAVEHLREDPEMFERGLATIARGLAAFSKRAIDAGASGIFFAASGAEPAMLSAEEYRRIVKAHDVEVLAAVKDAPFNVVHVHGTNVYLDLFLDYPARAINWPSHQSQYPISKVRKLTDKVLLAGIDERGPIAQGRIRGAVEQVNEAVADAGKKKFILGPECAVAASASTDLIMAVRDLAAQI